MSEGVLYYACALPPPVHGQSLVSFAILSELQRHGAPVVVMDLSPGLLNRTFAYHLTRMRKVLAATLRIIFSSAGKSVSLYSAVESGAGIIYNYVLVAAARSRGGAVFLHHHSAPHTKMRKARFAFLTYLAGTRACHIATSEQMAGNLRRYYETARDVLVSHPCSIITDPQAPFVGKQVNRWRIGYLSNLCLEKGMDIAIHAVQSVIDTGIDAEFHVAGPLVGVEAKLILSDAQERLGKRLVYWGPVYNEKKLQFFAEIDVFIFPSRYRNETQGLVNLEAMASFKPVIASDIGYISELLEYGGTTVSGEQKFSIVLQDKLRHWEADPARYEFEARRARLRFEELMMVARIQSAKLVARLVNTAQRDLKV